MSFPEGTPTVMVELGGKPRQLGFTMAAMRRCNEMGVLGLDTSDGVEMLLAIPGMVWACMSDADREELPFKTLEELLNPHNIRPIADQVTALFEKSMPEKEPGNAPPAAARKPTAGAKSRSISTSSGRSASTISA